MASDSESKSQRNWIALVVTSLAAYLLVGGVLSFAGWLMDAQRLTDWIGNGISIQPNTTIAVILTGLSLLLLSRGYHYAGAVLGGIVASTGASVLFQYATGIDLGIDALLMFGRSWGQLGVVMPGRMGPAGAISWSMIGMALILASRRKSRVAHQWAGALALLTVGLSSLSLIGYLYGASSLYTVPTLTIIALQTATFIFAASVALIMSLPERGPMRLLSENSPAGILARRIVPGLIAGPIMIGLVLLAGEGTNLYDAPFEAALRTLAEIALFLFLLWRTGVALNELAAKRRDADEQAQASRLQLEAELLDTRRLQRISLELIGENDMETLYANIVEAAINITRSDFGSMQMLYPERGAGGELRLLAFHGFNPVAAKTWELLNVESNTPCGEAFRTRQRVIVPDVTVCDYIVNSSQLGVFLDTGIRACQSTPLFSRSGKLVGVISTHWRNIHEPSERDLRLLDILARQAADLIDQRRVSEQAIERESAARNEAERAVRMKDDFLATLSHELRTPLNAILGWSQFLQRDIADPDKARYAAEVIERNGRLQAQLVTDLLDMSRILSGKMRLDVQRVDLPLAIQAAIESILPAAKAKGVRMELEIERFAGSVHGDSGRLQQVVWNLLSNAVKFTPGGGLVKISMTLVGGHVEVRVRDNGIGIPSDLLPAIFDRFRQADSSASRVHGGLGIGLALVKQLVELHGGKVHATSEGKGKGSTFIIELPISRAAEDRDNLQHFITPGSSLGPAPRLPSQLKGIRVLLIDDEPDALALVRRILEENEAEVRTAASSSDAIKVLNRESFNVIVSDIGMPGLDGYALIEELRRMGLQTPAIALTAFARKEDRTRAIRSGYQAHVAKPVEVAELLASISSLATGPLSILDRF